MSRNANVRNFVNSKTLAVIFLLCGVLQGSTNTSADGATIPNKVSETSADALFPENRSFEVTLPGGRTVTVIGVCAGYRAASESWWRPDGQPYGRLTKSVNQIPSEKGSRAVHVVLRVTDNLLAKETLRIRVLDASVSFQEVVQGNWGVESR